MHPFRAETRITKDMTVLDVVSEYRSTEAVFRSYDAKAGACVCCTCLFETVEALARILGLDLQAFLRELENAASGETSRESF
jgi:hypothetical protein